MRQRVRRYFIDLKSTQSINIHMVRAQDVNSQSTSFHCHSHLGLKAAGCGMPSRDRRHLSASNFFRQKEAESVLGLQHEGWAPGK